MSAAYVRKRWIFMEASSTWYLVDQNLRSVVVAGYFEGHGVPYFRVVAPSRGERHATLAAAMDAAEALEEAKATEGKP